MKDDDTLDNIERMLGFDATSKEAQQHEELEEQARKEVMEQNRRYKEELGVEEDIVKIEDYGTADPHFLLEQFNKRFIVVRKFYGKCAIIEPRTIYDPKSKSKKLELEPLSEEQFRKGFRNIIFEVEKKKKSIADIWLDWRKRRQIERIVFDPQLEPGLQPNKQEFNTWSGFSCEPIESDIGELLDFYRDVICAGDDYSFHYLMDMFAYGVQKPWEKWDKAVILMSEGEGSGKGVAANFYAQLFGVHKLELGDDRLLFGDFTGHFAHIAVVVANEVAITSKKAADKAKAIVDNIDFNIHHKGFTPKQEPNMMKLIITTNHEHAIVASGTARRWLCLKVSESKIGDYGYFDRLNRFYSEEGGKEGFLWYLRNRDISTFNKYKIVETDMLKDQKEHSLEPAKQAVLYLLDTGYCPKRRYSQRKMANKYRDLYSKINTAKQQIEKLQAEKNKSPDQQQELTRLTEKIASERSEVELYAEMRVIRKYLDDHLPATKNVATKDITKILRELGFIEKALDGYPRWFFPGLRDARSKFNEICGIQHKWSELEVWIDGNEHGEEVEY